jgi:hypothetical protein
MKPLNGRSKAKAFGLAAAVALLMGGHAGAADLPTKAPPPAPEKPFYIVNDTSVSFTWYPNATDPGVSGGANSVPGGIIGERNSFNKYTASLTHFDVWQYGTNFINADFIMSDGRDPIGGIAQAKGATEVYALARSTLGFNELTHSKMFSSPLFKNISFEWGGDGNTENNQLEPSVRKIDVGLQFQLNLPGTVNFAALFQKEWNHNSFWACGAATTGVACAVPAFGSFDGDRDFRWVPHLELNVIEPLTFTQLPLTWINFTGVNFPKGTGISQANLCAIGGCLATSGPFNGTNFFTANNASAFTKTEVFEDNRLTLDLSKLYMGKAGIWDGYVGYKYWYNKFGTDHNAALFSQVAPGTSIEKTAYVGTTYHFK